MSISFDAIGYIKTSELSVVKSTVPDVVAATDQKRYYQPNIVFIHGVTT